MYVCWASFFFSGVIFFVYYNYHFIIMLLSLEIFMLGLWCILMVYFGFLYYYMFFFLVVVVCMASIGVGLMVSSIRVVRGSVYYLV